MHTHITTHVRVCTHNKLKSHPDSSQLWGRGGAAFWEFRGRPLLRRSFWVMFQSGHILCPPPAFAPLQGGIRDLRGTRLMAKGEALWATLPGPSPGLPFLPE